MKIFLTMAVLLMVIACKESAVEQWITRAEECMEVDADSAYRCLHHAMEANEWNDELRARYALRYTQAMHKCRIPLEDDSLINTAVEYYTGSRDRHRLALSLLYKGLVHKQRKEVEQAAEAFALSEQWFEGVEDDRYKALLYNHYGILMYNQTNYKNALICLKKAYIYYSKGDSIHYKISACGMIANTFEIIEEIDSAKAYFEKGLQYKNQISAHRYWLYVKDYANSLRKNGDYEKAEQMLLECEPHITGERRYSLYSSLATLYYEMDEYGRALMYAEKVIESEDSVVVRGGLLNLYRIHRQLGHVNESQHFHDLFRVYDSDIELRMKTAEVAAIPHKMKVAQLANENSALAGWRMWLIVALLVITVLWWGIYRTIRCRHRREQHAKEQELAVKSEELESVGNKYGKTSAELGRLKGALTNHVDAMNRMKKEHQAILEKHRTEIEEQKRSVKELKEEIRDLKKADRATLRTENELKRTLHHLEKELEKRTDQLSEAEHQHEIDRRIEHFMASGECKRAVDMLLSLRLKRKVDARYDIGREEYHYLMMQLMEQENPALYAQLEQCGLDKKKRTLCCMIALGLDDIDMMAEAVCLSPYTVKEYYKDCEEVVEGCRD